MGDPGLAQMGSSFLPSIATTRKKREVVTGKGIDDLYTKNNESLLKHVDDNKNLSTEIEYHYLYAQINLCNIVGIKQF